MEVESELIFKTNEFEIINTKEKGKCVISIKNYHKNDILFIENFLVVPKDEVEGKGLTDHYFWSHKGKEDANAHLVFGLGTFLNHDFKPNTYLSWDMNKKVAIFRATRNISKGDEITLDYEDVWFENLKEPLKLKIAN